MFSGRRKVSARLAGALGVGAGVLGIGSVASAAEPTQQELVEQVKALQAKVEQMEARQQQGQQQQQQAAIPPAEEATIDTVLRDAERRSKPASLQIGGVLADLPAGYDKKFFIRSPDGKFSFSPSFQFQFRHVTNFREVPPDEEDEDAGGDNDQAIESGFEMRRMKFGAEGVAFGNFDYKFVWFTNRAGGQVLLEDAIVKYELNDDTKIVAGQFKDPVHHEELVSSTKQLSADRSLVNELLGGGVADRVQGVGIETELSDALSLVAVFHDGWATLNTNFRDETVNESDYGVVARVEYLAFGNKKAYSDFTVLGNTEDLLVFGAGADFSELEDHNGVLYTVDAQWETGRLGLYGALLGSSLIGHGDNEDENSFGGLVQAAYMLDTEGKWEAFGRYGYVDLDGDTVEEGEADSVHEVVGGMNYYMHGHAAKFTADLTYLPNGSPGESGLGILDSAEEDQFVLRVQFQLLI